jgi:hypothetical protein
MERDENSLEGKLKQEGLLEKGKSSYIEGGLIHYYPKLKK